MSAALFPAFCYNAATLRGGGHLSADPCVVCLGGAVNYLERLKPLALLLLRAALGIVFMAHGWPKLFGQNAGMQQFFADHGLPASFVYLTGVLELFGGGLLILGLFTRAVAFLLAIEMGVAIWKVHLVKGYLAVREYEYPLVLFTACFAQIGRAHV